MSPDPIQNQNLAWSRAFATQALSDLRVRDVLAAAGMDKCHRLHYLQMAAEKVCKAHLVYVNGFASVRKSHAYITRSLPVIARIFDPQPWPDWQYRELIRIAGEVQVAAPGASDGDLRLDNAEYPWLDASGLVQTPCLHPFPRLDDGPNNRTLVRIIRLLRAAAQQYL